MIKILESDDPVRLGFLRQVLEQADLHPFVFTMSGYPGVQPSRLMVPEAEEDLARQLIADVEGTLEG